MTGDKTLEEEHTIVGSRCNSTIQETKSNDDQNLMEEYVEKPTVPQRRPIYKRKKYWIICSIMTVIVTVVAVVVALYVIFPLIAQMLMDKASISVDKAQITFNKPDALDGLTYSKRDGDDMNSTFYMNMESSLSNTGPFSANIKFHNPIEVLYEDQALGSIFLFNDTSIATGHGSLNAITPFLIKNQTAFASFAKDMLAAETFKWKLRGKLDITALTRTATVNLDKEITLNGMNGFPDVHINSFQLPGDSPYGGILVELGTILNSPSPIGVQLGTINLAIGYDGIDLGTVKANNVNLEKGDNNILLKGTLKPQNDSAALEKVGHLFSNYVSGKLSSTTAIGISAAPDGINPITWLSEGFQSVKLNVALTAAQPLKIINAVDMGYLDLKFDQNNAYSPTVIANDVTASYEIPFGFSLNITEVAQNISLAVNSSKTESTEFAVIRVPTSPAVTDSGAGTLKFAINNAIDGISGEESSFDDYIYALTASNQYTFMVAGNATARTNTPIGTITLSGISFNVPTSLHGLQFLNSTATTINSLDVIDGTSDNLLLSINVTMTNPSDFSIFVGDVRFAMSASEVELGAVMLGDLYLARGQNTVTASATFNPKISNVGQNLLSTFIMGQDNGVQITGYDHSTPIKSLSKSLGAIDIDTTLPGLKAALIQGGSMSVLPDTVNNGVVGVKVSLANPFTAGLSVTKVIAAATFNGMPVGNIDQDISSSPFVVPGKSVSESQQLSMTMNVEPASIALLLRSLAVQANMDTRSLDGLLNLGGFNIVGQEDVQVNSELFKSFNISSYVLDAMKALKVDLTLTSGIAIGQYTDDLTFSQSSVAISTDSSITSLIPLVGQPIVQQIVDGAVLGFESITLSAPTDSDFTVQMKGSITKSGPIDATISFPSPLTVAWQGKTLGTVTMPDIQAKADTGATFDVTGKFSIANTDDMATFSSYLINNADFEWDITTKDVSVTALGFTFAKITMEKFVTLAGAQGFKSAVTINSFDLPSNDPAGGITLTAQTAIKNPSQVGFNLSGVTFEAFYKGTDLGPLSSDGQALFAPQETASLSMKGRLVHQDSSAGITAVTEVFENYLHANASIVDVKGVSASGPNGQVGWLTKAFKSLSIENVVLPGPIQKPELIPAITLNDMQLDFTKDPWGPLTGSTSVQAQLKSPFGFPLDVSKLNMNVVANYNGIDVASLFITDQSATTSSTGLVTTQFSNTPFKAIDKATFTGFLQLLTVSNGATFGLKGISNAQTETAIGTLSLKDISFDVQTSLAGFSDFGGKIVLPTPDVVGGTSQYTLLDFSFTLTNPSNITITIGDINFDVVMNEFNTVIGVAYLKNVIIPPGQKICKGQLHLGEKSTNSKAIEQIFSDYLTSAKVPLTIQGSTSSTKIEPLIPALSSVKLSTEMTGMNANLISQIAVKGSITGLVLLKKAASAITLRNPLKTSYSITKVQASVIFKPSSGESPFTVGTIDYSPSVKTTVPAGGSITTDDWPVSVVSGGLEHLREMLTLLTDPNKYFDVQQNVTVVVGDGYTTNMFYYQDRVPFTISIDGLPPIGISPGSLPDLSSLANLTKITDPNALEQTLKDILSGKPLFSSEPTQPSNTTTLASIQTTSSSIETTTLSDIVTTSATTTTVTTITTTTESVGNPTTTSAEPAKGFIPDLFHITKSEPTKTAEAPGQTTSSQADPVATVASKLWLLPF